MNQVFWSSGQNVGFPKAGVASAGSSVLCNDTIGGLTPNTAYTMFLPADKTGTNLVQENAATISLTPANFLSFGRWVWFDKPDIAAGENSFPFMRAMRNGSMDLGLKLVPFGAGHRVELLRADGTTVATMDDPFEASTKAFVETFYDPSSVGSAIVEITSGSGQRKSMAVGGNFRGDATSTALQIYMEGQLEASAPSTTNTALRYGPLYVANDVVDTSERVGNGATTDGLDCYSFRNFLTTGAAGCKKDGTFGSADALDAGTWDLTSDGSAVTSADYTGAAGVDVGSIKELATAPGDGPAPHFNKWDTGWYGNSLDFVTFGATGGTYSVGWGTRSSVDNYAVSTQAVGIKLRHTQVIIAANVLPAPTQPDESEIFAMGHFVNSGSTGKTLKLRMAAAHSFGKFGMGGNYLMKSKMVDGKTGLVGEGGGRVG